MKPAKGQLPHSSALGPACSTPATIYCTAKTNSLGCTPSIGMFGQAGMSYNSGCTLTMVNVMGQKSGLYFHSTVGAQAVPFHGGLFCVRMPMKRHALLNSGGTAGTCTGVFAEDFNAYIASGKDPALVAGATIWIQNWSRDPGDPYGDSLSDAITGSICP